MQPADVERVIGQAARRVKRHIPVFMDQEDLEQEARLAFLLRPAPEGETPLHSENLVRLCARNSMVEALRSAWHSRNHTPLFLSLDAENESGEKFTQYDPVAPDDPERLAMLKQAVERLQRVGTERLRECVTLLAQGLEPVEVASAMRISPSRVSQLLTRGRELMSTCL